jgi:hypothetical protein
MKSKNVLMGLVARTQRNAARGVAEVRPDAPPLNAVLHGDCALVLLSCAATKQTPSVYHQMVRSGAENCGGNRTCN